VSDARLITTALFTILVSSGCATKSFQENRPQLNMSPVGCGYKWFQSGYSPDRLLDCSEDRSELHAPEKQLAVADAWRIAISRCPNACPPIELSDSAAAEERWPEGRCDHGVVYYVSRVFFQCSER
jgi:hypothetical protein